MLTLSGKGTWLEGAPDSRLLLSLATQPDLPLPLRQSKAYLSVGGQLPDGFAAYIVFEAPHRPKSAPVLLVGEEFRYLGDEDIISIAPEGDIRSLFRAASEHNSLLLTERCNNYCLMCSQPPKRGDDSWLLEEAIEAVRLIPRETKSIGLTGGEPTLYGDDFIRLVRHIKHWLPNTALHVLSNGRRFSDHGFARQYAEVQHPDLMIGIPIYSADPARHDYVVQSKGAFDETVRGILNLKRHGQQVEVRVVLHKQTFERLPALAEFIARNLLFVDHVALMGLEMTGFTRANLDSLWIDPIEYREQLSEAVRLLRAYGVRTSVYNHPLCLINEDVAQNYVKSISDWKNEYPDECSPCKRKDACGGFFSSGIRYGYSKSITPFV